MKSVLETRPVYHRLASRGHADLEWAQILRDLDRVEEVEVEKGAPVSSCAPRPLERPAESSRPLASPSLPP